MDMNEQDFYKELIAMFKTETGEHLTTIHRGLRTLESNSSADAGKQVMEEVHRAAHSLKGAARTVGLVDIETAGKYLERLFLLVRNGQMLLTPQLAGILHDCADILDQLISTLDEQGALQGDALEIVHRLEAAELKLNA